MNEWMSERYTPQKIVSQSIVHISVFTSFMQNFWYSGDWGVWEILLFITLWCASRLCSLQFDGVSVRDVLLLCDHLKSHGVCLSTITLPAHPHLLVGYVVSATANQALLDDGYYLHTGQYLHSCFSWCFKWLSQP